MPMKHTDDCVERQTFDILLRLWRPELASNPHAWEAWRSKFDVSSYDDVQPLKKDYFLYSFLRKWKGEIKDSSAPEKAAFEMWLSCERRNRETNDRLKQEMATGVYSLPLSIISDAQRKIASVLGRPNWDLLSSLCRFGNGATATLRRGSTHADKTHKPSITFDAIPYACIVLANDAWLQDKVGGFADIDIVRANRMEMAPKNSEIHRPVCPEPTLNSFIQQALGRYIRIRLKKFGVDLNDQTINQDLARRAVREGFATLDLSSASDTLSRALVELLLPPCWYEIFDALRSKFTTYKGQTFWLEKFSSMGNAFTFELESLIFWALSESAAESKWCSVYGDDIVCRQSDADSVIATLEWAGFTINKDKSFTDGKFFESCGKHYLDGEDVTPPFQKDVAVRPIDYIRLHNRLMRASIRLGLPEVEFACEHVRRAYRSAFSKQPQIGPFVEYDEFFISPDYVWGERDRVALGSWVTISRTTTKFPPWKEESYLGLRLRTGVCSATDPKGHIAEPTRDALRYTHRVHWRSSDVLNV